VVGCGRVGLPLALCLAARGHRVLGVDTDARIRDAVRGGRLPFPDRFAAPLLDETLGRTFDITGDLGRAAVECQTFIIALGTPLDSSLLPEQSALREVVARILGGTLGQGPTPPFIAVRSTLVPGGTNGLIRMARRRWDAVPGKDFLIAYCPERSLEGASHELLELPQIVGAEDERSREAARRVFGPLGVELVFTGILEAELGKLFNNAHRYVNFALSNEFLMIAMNLGASGHEAIRVANEGYPRGGIPSCGYAAGPCLSKDGFFLTQSLPTPELLLTAWRLNESLPLYFVEQVEKVRPISSPVVLGLAFKADSDDPRNSLGLKLMGLLRMRGLDPVAHDPLVAVPGSTSDLPGALRGAREVFVAVPHKEYRALTWDELGRLAAPGAVIADPWLVWGQGRPVFQLGPQEETRRS